MDDDELVCQGCGERFSSRQALLLHNEETHGGGSTGGEVDDVITPDSGDEPVTTEHVDELGGG